MNEPDLQGDQMPSRSAEVANLIDRGPHIKVIGRGLFSMVEMG